VAFSISRTILAAAVLAVSCLAVHAQTTAELEYFEKSVRPVLVKNCQMCHNSKAKTSQLDLSTVSGFLAGGASGPVFSKEHPEESRLLKVVSYDEDLKMPPMGKLKAEDIAALTAWIKMGAPWPGADQAAVAPPAPKVEFTPEQKSFWAFQAPKEPAKPTVHDAGWVQTPIDAFVLAKLEEKGLKPAPPADKATLLRRVTFDLIGLPPTPEEMRGFLADQSPDAFRKVVDRLLASPRYGERWGRHWLDVARYADSTGNDEDHRYPYAWRYRDYVIDAFNNDLPYNQFVREQIAGDLLPSTDPNQPNRRGIVATGFLALGAKALAQQDKKKMLYDVYDEQVDVTSKAFLGLTMACARCHNHKFDPILTKDYYGMVSMFASTKDFANENAFVAELLNVPLVPKAQYAIYQEHQDHVSALSTSIEAIDSGERLRFVRAESNRMAEYMLAAGGSGPGEQLDAAVLKKWTTYLKEGSKAHPQLADWDNASAAKRPEVAKAYQKRFQARLEEWAPVLEKWQGEVLAAKLHPPDRPKFETAKDLFFYEVYEHENGPFVFDEKEGERIRSVDAKEKIAALQKQKDQLKANAPPDPDMACAVVEGKPVDQKVFMRGDYNNPGEDAPKAFPTILRGASDPAIHTTSGRLELAEWIANPRNPATARVMANRVWSWHFGDGIVRTPDNFGKMGDRPANPELLDFLALRFVESGWSIKALQRMILLSSTYQMASDTDDRTMEADPENRLMTRFNRQRLDVEEIRDGVLALDNSLDTTMGGSLQKGRGTDGENSSDRLSLDPLKLTRRTVYLPLRRANLPTLLNLFDFGDATTVNGKRTITNVAPQALFAMNSEFGFEHARKLAEALLAMKDVNDAKRVEAAYTRILNRAPSSDEVDSSLTYVEKYSAKYGGKTPQIDAWQSFCHILLSSNEFLYLD
jgi:cytochrome c553